MVFSSIEFIGFFLIYLVCHRFTPQKHRSLVIVLGGLAYLGFYHPEYLWVPLFLALAAHIGARSLEKAAPGPGRKLRLSIILAVLLAPLIFFKYTDFLYVSVLGLFFETDTPLLGLPFPLGISFITFTVIAYVVDVYKGKYQAEQSFKHVAAYTLFFPKLPSGPIVRPHEFIPRLKRPVSPKNYRFVLGVSLFTLGLIKKVVFADNIAPFVNLAYQSAQESVSGGSYLLAFYGYSMQIYCDFSGYIDMALGLAFILGIRLPINFRQPYLATSFADFWRRWHLTLSFWLRDYLYIPLGGNRKGFFKQARNVFITMGLGGLWHGANWTFIVWGLFHACGIVVWHGASKLGLKNFLSRVPRWVSVVITFHFISAAWVFFRAPDLSSAFAVLAGPFVSPWGDLAGFFSVNMFPILLLVTFLLTHKFDDFRRVVASVRRYPRWLVIGVVVFLLVLTVVFSGGNSGEFIYFDF